MRPQNPWLLLVLTILLALGSACSSARLPEQRVEAKVTEARSQQNETVVAATVKAKKANLREHPSEFATVVGTVRKGDLLSLIDLRPTGPWYRIRDNKTGADGWIHGNTITLLQTSAGATPAQRPRTVSTSRTNAPPTSDTPPQSSRRSYVNVDGVRVQSPTFSDTKPAGASARCRDGSYSFSLNRRGTCSHHGGVAEWY
jgi:uncharacterized protein YgiM (DUF1202 family)